MAASGPVVATQIRTDLLSRCGNHWGEEALVPEREAVVERMGDPHWFETAVPGVVGLNGNETGKGPGIVIRDVENSGIDILWTEGLTGCMGLAILGTDEQGKRDAFFSHARHYDKAVAVDEEDNPMRMAREFVRTHKDIRVFWGTDFNFGDPKQGPEKKAQAQMKLSRELGCWVRENDCVVYSQLSFFPKLGLMTYGKPQEAVARLESKDLETEMRFSRSKCLKDYAPDPVLLGEMEERLRELRMDRQAFFRLRHQDSKRDNKIEILSRVIEAYKVGNLDVLHYFKRSAEQRDNPFLDAASVNAWESRRKEGRTTSQLVEGAFTDALEKIRAMNPQGCGVWESGQSIYNAKDYGKAFPVDEPSEREGLGAHR